MHRAASVGMKWAVVAVVFVLMVAGVWVVAKDHSNAQPEIVSAPSPIGTSGTHAGAAEDHVGAVITEVETITGTTNATELVGRRVDLHVDVQKRANDDAFWVGSPDNRVLVVIGRDARNGVERQRGLSTHHHVVPIRDGQRATVSGVIRQVPGAEQRYSWNLTNDDARELEDRRIYIRADAVMSEGHGTD